MEARQLQVISGVTKTSDTKYWISSRSVVVHGAIGAVCLMAALIECLGLWTAAPYFRSQVRNDLVLNLLFLSSLHNVFTMTIVQISPEFSKRTTAVHKKYKWFLPFTALFALAVFSIHASREFISLSGVIVIWFAMILPRFHMMAQMKGLSLNLVRPTNGLSALPRLWNAALFLFLASNVAIYLFPSTMLLRTLVFLNLAVFGILLGFSLLPLKDGRYPKWAVVLFHSKVLLFPIALVSPIAAMAVAALHGLEYASVTRHLLKVEAWRDHTRALCVGGLSLMALAIVTYVAATSWTIYGSIAFGLMLAASAVHYCYDAVLFRARHFYT